MKHLEGINEFDYKKIEFNYDGNDGMFDYWHPDLSSIGINMNNKERKETYLATNKKRHLHIQITPNLQNKGLAEKIIKAFVYREGFRIIPKGRILNDDVIKVLDKVNNDKNFTVSDEGDQYIIEEN